MTNTTQKNAAETVLNALSQKSDLNQNEVQSILAPFFQDVQRESARKALTDFSENLPDDLYRELSLFRDNAYPEPGSPASRVRVGQTWQDTDKRSNKRLIRILEIRDGKAIVETTRDRYDNRIPAGNRRTAHVRLDRFQKKSRGFVLRRQVSVR